jgi:TonB family protein
MRRFSGFTCSLSLALFILFAPVARIALAQAAEQQTARQALIEMFFGDAPNHMEKHLADITKSALQKMQSGNINSLGALSMLVQQAKSGNRKEKIETFDTGSTLVNLKEIPGASFDNIETTVEQDSFSGDEDAIELGVHVTRNGKEDTLPFIPRFTFTMKMESGIWKLNEVGASVRIPLADPDFLKGLMERQRAENEQMMIFSMQSVIAAENSYHSANNGYACSLAGLGAPGKQSGIAGHGYLYDQQLLSGKKNGYAIAISNCDATHYQLAAEPAAPEAGQRAFCADESGTLRASSDGKATTCVSSGKVVADAPKAAIAQLAAPSSSASGSAPAKGMPQRVRVSPGVTSGLLTGKVNPVYPAEARAARIQGTVILKAVISATGEVSDLQLISGHPMLAPAAIDAVKQWKYKPYLLNGKPVEVETQIQVNFALSER